MKNKSVGKTEKLDYRIFLNKDKHVRASTLLELLFVIVILSMLVAILSPAIKAARDISKRAACICNLKQIGQMTIEYSQENDGYLPFAYHLTEASWDGFATVNNPAWYVLLAPYANIRTYNYYVLGGPAFGNWLKQPCLFTCPSQNFNYPNSVPVSYAPGTRIATEAPENGGQLRGKLNMINNPAAKILISDSYHPCFFHATHIFPGGAAYSAWHRHGNGANGVFFDGHVEWIDYEKAKSPHPYQIETGGIFDPYK
ncbi:MAG: prepilin-type N-terminal cleavage/methylation domain-containing protein [Verrucomicrobiae bacterium]|nr:prepilin-type N-terminal cleavage/methylation domain-containing protein [Verrucomicrobiae bacterium]